jgi:diguanylate cyclase (GGDEF)-like protein/PAS domain S-box-containing protein
MQPRQADPVEARLRAVVAVARALTEAVADERRFARVVVDLAARLVGDGATLWLPAADGTTLTRAGATHAAPNGAHRSDPPGPADGVDPSGDPAEIRADADDLVAAVLETAAPAVLGPGDVSAYLDEMNPRLVPWLNHRGVASTAIVPLRGDAGATGVLVATRDAGRPEYSDADVCFLQALADVAAATLASAYLLNGSAAAVEEMRRQADLIDQVSDVIMAWDFEQGIITWNAAAERVYLYSSAEALGCDADALLATRYLDGHGEEPSREQIAGSLLAEGSWTGELRQRRADGEEIEILGSITGLFDWQGRLVGGVAVNRDVTDQRRKERQALRDALTGLPNRRFLVPHLREALARCANGEGPLAVLFLDLNGFKQVNDTLGHEAGDEVLRVTARRLDLALRRHDVVTRLGGDEFVAVTEQVGGRKNAEDVAMRLLAASGHPIPIGDVEVVVLPSIGVAFVESERAGDLTPDELIREADEAMYVAKRGRSGLAFAA